MAHTSIEMIWNRGLHLPNEYALMNDFSAKIKYALSISSDYLYFTYLNMIIIIGRAVSRPIV